MTLVVALAAAGAMIGFHVARPWRLALVAPFYVAMLGFFQAREKTWVKLAARGQRDMDSGPQAITDADELRQVRRQARIVHAKSLAAALVFTVVIYFL